MMKRTVRKHLQPVTKRCVWLGLVMILALSACTGSPNASPTPPLPAATEAPTATAEGAEAVQATEPVSGTSTIEGGTLTVMTHDSFAVSESVIQAFEEQYNVKVQILESGDVGTALNKAILSANNPLADVFYGVDSTFLSRALEEGIFEPYESHLLADIPDEYELDSTHAALPVDWGDVCLNYDIAYFTENNLTPPQNLEDLARPAYKSLLVVENPATSSPGLSFLLATIGHFGEDGYLNYWQSLVENDVLVTNDWDTAYYAEFTRAGGTRPVVVSYGSSPAFEVIYSATPVETPPTGVVTSPGSCFRQIEFVGILKGTQQRDLAEKWVDFMLSPTFQQDVPMQMFVFPVNQEAQLDENFQKFLSIAEEPAQIDPQQIAEQREAWIQAWTEMVLR